MRGLHASLRRASLGFLVGLACGVLIAHLAPVVVELHVWGSANGTAQVFIDTGGGFNETQSRRFPMRESTGSRDLEAPFWGADIDRIRIDPLEAPGDFELTALELRYLFWRTRLEGRELLGALIPASQVSVELEGASLIGRAEGVDPYLVMDAAVVEGWRGRALRLGAAVGALLGFVVALIPVQPGRVLPMHVRHRVALLGILVVAGAFRLAYWSASPLPSEPAELGSVWSDEGTYFSLAQYVLSNGLVDYLTSERSVWVAPFTPLYLAAGFGLSESIDVLRLLNVTASVATTFFVYVLGRAMFGATVGLAAAAVCAVHGSLVRYAPTLLTEPWFVFWLCAAILATGMLTRSSGRVIVWQILLGVLLFLLALTRSIALLLPFAWLALALLHAFHAKSPARQQARDLARRLILPTVIYAVSVGAVTAKNYALFGTPILATGAGTTLWLGSRPDTEGDDPPHRGLPYETAKVTRGASHLTPRGDARLMAAARENIRDHLPEYLWWNVKKIGRLTVGNASSWFYPHRDLHEWHAKTGRNLGSSVIKTLEIALAVSIVVFGALGMYGVWRSGPLGWLVIATVAYLLVFSLPFFVIPRFGLPIVVLLTVPAAWVVIRGVRSRGATRSLLLGGGAASLIITLAIAW